MPEPLKNVFTKSYLTNLSNDFKLAYPDFQAEDFVASVMDSTWDALELKGRTRQITLNLGKFLPQDYPQAIAVIDRVVAAEGSWNGGFSTYFSDFVEVYGQDPSHWDISMAALARYTPYPSSEFAVRPFIINHPERMMAQMEAWSLDENEDVRRLASEGCRPALPWGQALQMFKQDPTPVLPILERLKGDKSLYVRKSVANNLNDISKTHPDIVLALAKKWMGESKEAAWVAKHGARTLLKKGNPEALAIFGIGGTEGLTVSGFSLGTNTVAIGDSMAFWFTLEVERAAPTKIRLEYAIDYVKANGTRSRKIFKISELTSQSSKTRLNYRKTHEFRDLTTRKHYPGCHGLAIVVNGVAQEMLEFELCRG